MHFHGDSRKLCTTYARHFWTSRGHHISEKDEPIGARRPATTAAAKVMLYCSFVSDARIMSADRSAVDEIGSLRNDKKQLKTIKKTTLETLAMLDTQKNCPGKGTGSAFIFLR